MANSDITTRLSPPASFPFPGELLHQIIGYLDPTSLWALSQTAKYFRHVISPGHNERLEWLLDVECLEENGGGIELFVGNFNPVLSLVHWEAHRWLCTGCMRLLPHFHFNNHSILRLAYRKPSPTSPAVAPLTTWTPTRHGKKWGLEGANFKSASPLQRCGAKRRHRRCNECLYRAGRLAYEPGPMHGYAAGTLETPIQKGRYLPFQCALDRYFPNMSDTLGQPSPPFNKLVFNEHQEALEEFWTMYMVRCPGCGKWQELRGFRFGATYQAWVPMHDGRGRVRYQDGMVNNHVELADIRCNSCFAEEHGVEALGRALQEWIMVSMKLVRWWTDVQLLRGWPAIQFNQGRFRAYKKDIRRLLNDTVDMRGIADGGCLSYSQVALLRLRHQEFREIWNKIMASDNPEVLGRMHFDRDFQGWLNNFHESEVTWRWLRGCHDEIMARPDLLVKWALSQDRVP